MSHRARPQRSPIATMLAGMALSGALVASLPATAGLRLQPVQTSYASRDVGLDDAPRGDVETVRIADADCSAAAAEAAAQTGGQVLSVSSRNDGGRTVCVVTVLVPGEGGQRPRKRTLTLPQ